MSPRNLVIGGDTYTWGDVPVRLWIENLRLPTADRRGWTSTATTPSATATPTCPTHPLRAAHSISPTSRRLSRLVDRYLARPGHVIKLFLSEWTIPTSRFDNEFNFYVTAGGPGPMDHGRLADRPELTVHLRARMDPPAGRSPGHGSSGGLLDYRGHPKPGYFAFKNG